ncbi:uncharacterized protein BJ212DRAFT_1528927 [Suillus subaureus]|uniref:Uncharacterized protein n=1 Tax=Suillus subaureus TaxID=48587 RepID=A0A9P7ASS1_9AGAM|nr:uncharacterized protein BJ212DRAFT_1528927 [Suillus subaureus]KAG1794952.1 hypothetical protein BJ212DRAFT_1528927 [Suillus subaureus]
MSMNRYKCSCACCSQHPDGFMYQTRQVITKHAKKYPPVLQPTGVNTNADAGANPMNDASRASSESEGTDHRERPEIPPQVREDEYDFEFQHMDDQHAEEQPRYPAEQQAPVQELQDFNFRLVAWPDVRVPGTFQERPGVRLAYLNTVIGNVFGKQSIQAATDALNNQLNCMLLEGVLPEHPRPWITQYAICPECWKHFTPAQVKELPSPESLCRMFMQPGFAKSVRDSRQDCPGQNEDEDYVMTDMHDGMMGILENQPHSSGPIYYAINDLPRDQRFLQVNVICTAIMPGPKEPNIVQINCCLEPSTRELMELKNGVKMDVYGEEELADVFADNEALACDMPALHKCNGTAGHSHDFHPCAFCDVNIIKINTPEGYNNSWTDKNDYHMLRQSFYSKDATPTCQEAILQDHGVRFSILNVISGWLPLRKSALDFMHCIFLGIISHLFMCVLFGGYMFLGMGGVNSPKRRFEDIINAVRWPSHVTQLPKNLGENQSLKKADKWCCLLMITLDILWWSWRDTNDEIPDTEPPLPPNTIALDFSRNCHSLYKAILFLCTGVQILASCMISMAQARTGQSFLAHYCLECLQLCIPLTINHQALMHTADMIKKFGPVYAWWLFIFERFNGMLECVQYNGHDGGRIELILLQNWINCITKVQAQDRGSMMMQIAVYQSEAAEDNVRLPLCNAKLINLRAYGSPQGVFYPILLQYCHSLWPDLHLVDDLSCDNGTPFYVNKVARRTRVPVQITALFVVGVLDVIPHVCAVVWRLVSDDDIPAMPWDLYASTLGIHVPYTELGPQEVVPVSRIKCPLALISVHLNVLKKDLWITVSFDHVSLQTVLLYNSLKKFVGWE